MTPPNPLSRSIHLRFWVNILKNPEFIFDIHKPPIMDSYLTVMSQCFIDSCSCSEQFLNVVSGKSFSIYYLAFKILQQVHQMRDCLNIILQFWNDLRIFHSPRIPKWASVRLLIQSILCRQCACLSGGCALNPLWGTTPNPALSPEVPSLMPHIC